MSDTKFPWDEIADNYGEEYIMPWFKRCIEDRPQGTERAHRYFMEYTPPTDAQQRAWFDKWFGQFKEKPKFPKYISVEEF